MSMQDVNSAVNARAWSAYDADLSFIEGCHAMLARAKRRMHDHVSCVS